MDFTEGYHQLILPYRELRRSCPLAKAVGKNFL